MTTSAGPVLPSQHVSLNLIGAITSQELSGGCQELGRLKAVQEKNGLRPSGVCRGFCIQFAFLKRNLSLKYQLVGNLITSIASPLTSPPKIKKRRKGDSAPKSNSTATLEEKIYL